MSRCVPGRLATAGAIPDDRRSEGLQAPKSALPEPVDQDTPSPRERQHSRHPPSEPPRPGGALGDRADLLAGLLADPDLDLLLDPLPAASRASRARPRRWRRSSVLSSRSSASSRSRIAPSALRDLERGRPARRSATLPSLATRVHEHAVRALAHRDERLERAVRVEPHVGRVLAAASGSRPPRPRRWRRTPPGAPRRSSPARAPA